MALGQLDARKSRPITRDPMVVAVRAYVTHDQIEAMTMADKIFVMNAGRVEQIGTPLELHDRSANLFVATCMGSGCPSRRSIRFDAGILII